MAISYALKNSATMVAENELKDLKKLAKCGEFKVHELNVPGKEDDVDEDEKENKYSIALALCIIRTNALIPRQRTYR